jgi:hypothetical protein
MPRPSGLVVIEEIARTVPVLPTEKPKAGNGNIMIPTASHALMLELVDKADASGKLVESIECDSLEEFAASGVRRWRELVPRLGGVTSVSLDLAEKSRWTDATSPQGVVLPEPATREFEGYFASPDEIEALSKMALEISVHLRQNPANNTGVYV